MSTRTRPPEFHPKDVDIWVHESQISSTRYFLKRVHSDPWLLMHCSYVFWIFYIKHWKLISQRNKCRIWGGFPINETSKSAALPHPVDIDLPVNMVIMYERGHTIGKTPLSGREYIKNKKKNIVKSQCPSLSQSYCVMRWNDCTREAFKTGLRWQFPLRTALINIQNLICLYLAASWLNNASLLHAKTTAGCQR